MPAESEEADVAFPWVSPARPDFIEDPADPEGPSSGETIEVDEAPMPEVHDLD